MKTLFASPPLLSTIALFFNGGPKNSVTAVAAEQLIAVN